MRVIWQIEIDPYASRVLAKHWPDVARFRDVRECGSHNLERVNLICGGFPCQDVSLAGKRAGLDGERSTLWSEFARIIRELKPDWVLAENVPGLLSSDNGQFMGNVLRDLAQGGYDAEWDCIPASAVGAPHRRDRVWIVAHARNCRYLAANTGDITQSDGAHPAGQHAAETGGCSADVAHTQERSQSQQPCVFDSQALECPGIGTGGGIGGGHPAEGIPFSRRTAAGSTEDVAHPFQSRLAQRQGVPGDNEKEQPAIERDGVQPVAHAAGGNGYHVRRNGTQANATRDGTGDRTCSVESDLGRAVAWFSGGLDGTGNLNAWADGWEDGTPRVASDVPHRVDRLRCLGNSVVPQVAEFIGRLIMHAHAQEAT